MRNVPLIPRPEPAAAVVSPQRAKPSQTATVGTVIVLGVLWTWVGVFMCIGLSGLVGVVFGDPRPGTTGDGTYVGIGLGLLPIGGLPLLILRRHWRDRIRAHGLPVLARSSWGRAIAGSGTILFGALISIAFVSDPTPNTVGSLAMARASLVTSMAALAIGCGYPLLRWRQAQQKNRH